MARKTAASGANDPISSDPQSEDEQLPPPPKSVGRRGSPAGRDGVRLNAPPSEGTRSRSSARKSQRNQEELPSQASSTAASKKPEGKKSRSTRHSPSTPDKRRTRSKSCDPSPSSSSPDSSSAASDRSVQIVFSDPSSDGHSPPTSPTASPSPGEIFSTPTASEGSSPCPLRWDKRGSAAVIRVEDVDSDPFIQTDETSCDAHTDNQAGELGSDGPGQSDKPTPDGHAETHEPIPKRDPAPESCGCCVYNPYRPRPNPGRGPFIRTEAELDSDLRERLLGGPKAIPKKKANKPDEKSDKNPEQSPEKEKIATTGPKFGYNYIFFRESHDGFTKLGSCKRLTKRLRKLNSSSPLVASSASEGTETTILPGHTLESTQSFQAIPYYRFVESVLQNELHNVRRELNYKGSTLRPESSTEWFEISVDKATEIRDKWVKWVDKWEPYDHAGDIKPFWDERIAKCGAYAEWKQTSLCRRCLEGLSSWLPKWLLYDVDDNLRCFWKLTNNRGAFTDGKHYDLHRRWIKILNPWFFEPWLRSLKEYMNSAQSKRRSYIALGLLLRDILQLMFFTNIFSLTPSFYLCFTFLIYQIWLPESQNNFMKERGKTVMIFLLLTLVAFLVGFLVAQSPWGSRHSWLIIRPSASSSESNT